MTPVAPTFFFYLLSAVAVFSAILVITRKNPVHSAMSLIFTLLSLAGLYLMLYAPFVAGVQIILYAGGIMVLFLFVIMLVNIERAQREMQFSQQWPVGILASLVLGILFGIGMVALAFQARASWESHRDWVVPVTVPLLVVAGLGLGFLAARLRWIELALPVGLLVLALVLTILNILRGIATDGEDGLRDAMTIITAVLLGFSVASLIAALAWVEFRNPIRPPAPEM